MSAYIEGTDWIEWKGGKQPLPDHVLVEVMWNDGKRDKAKAGVWAWGNKSLIAYRRVLVDLSRTHGGPLGRFKIGSRRA